MNRRIEKKHEQHLVVNHASKYKYVKLAKKQAHKVSIETAHCMHGLKPTHYTYDKWLLRRRHNRKRQFKQYNYGDLFTKSLFEYNQILLNMIC